jgi:hypothetical protein
VRYLLIHCPDNDAPAHASLPSDLEASLNAWLDETIGRGINLGGAKLQAASEGRCVRVRDGQVLVSDGPFAETKEQVAGYDVIECADLREAVDVARRHPTAVLGAIEIRPLARDGGALRPVRKPGRIMSRRLFTLRCGMCRALAGDLWRRIWHSPVP